MSSQVDLRQLAVERAAPAAARPLRRRNWLTRWVIPGVIVAGFGTVIGWSLQDRLLPAKPVTVVPVVMARAEVQQSGTPLFQAAGWIEPRPSAVLASALVEGVVETMMVIEGQEVKAGEPVAKLVSADANFALREAEINLQLRQAELDLAEATLAAAEQNLKQPAHLEAALAEAETTHTAIDAELKNLPFLIRSAEARLTFAEQDLKGKQGLGNSIAGRSVQKAQSEHDAALASLDELKQRTANLQAQHESTNRKSEALRLRLRLKTDETRARDEAKANADAAEAKVAQAKLSVEVAKLKVERMIVRSPITGRVLALSARPGARLMGLNAASQQDSSTVVSIYDPQQLQVRADVRLEDVPQVLPGQPVQISTAASREPLTGTVIATTSLADIQKNTLQVKVSIDNPSAVLKPEMLVQVTFLAPELPQDKSEGSESSLRLLVPRDLVENSESGSAAWVADTSTGVARQKSIQLGTAGTDQLVEVTQGLSALDKLIVGGREGLQNGARIRVTGEDLSLGRSKSISTAAVSNSTATK